MPLVTVAKVKRFPTPADKLACCYVGRRAWGWPQTPWANPFKLRPIEEAGTHEVALADSLGVYRAWALASTPRWWADLWAACRQGELSLACWCYAGPAEHGVSVCHAAILADELNRRLAAQSKGNAP